MRLKIALVSDWYAPRLGGVESQLVDLAHELAARGHEPHIITATPQPAATPTAASATVKAAAAAPAVHALAVPLLPGWQVVRSRAALAALDRIYTRERFDVVHGHSLYSPLALAATWLARKRDIPSVLTSHSLLDPAARLVLRSLGAHADVRTAVSSVCAAEVDALAGAPATMVLPNGIRVADWAPAGPRPRTARATVEVVSVMRLAHRKRPRALLAAAARVARALPRVRFTVVGDGPLGPALERQARALGLGERLRLVGGQPRWRVRELLAAADLFVLPTIKEAFGLALLEARAAGLPVVAMRGGGVADLVEHGREGLLAGDDDELARHLVRLCSDDTLRARMAARARVGLERFDWQAVAARYLAVYARALGRAGDSNQADAADGDEAAALAERAA